MTTLHGIKRNIFKKAINLSNGLYKHNYMEIFANKNRITIAVESLDFKTLNSYKIVETYLEENGYFITDYKGGYCMRDKNKNVFKIGRIIKDNKYVSDNFRDCISRQSVELVLSRHPYDVACASFGQEWSSCLNVGEDDGYESELWNSIAANTLLIAYLVGRTDGKKKPHVLGRTFIIPYICEETGNHWLYPADTAYGIFDEKYITQLESWLDKNYNNKYIMPKIDTFTSLFVFPKDRVFDNNNAAEITVVNPKFFTDKEYIDSQLHNGCLGNVLDNRVISLPEVINNNDLTLLLERIEKFIPIGTPKTNNYLYNLLYYIKSITHRLYDINVNHKNITLPDYFNFLKRQSLVISRDICLEYNIITDCYIPNKVKYAKLYASVLDDDIDWTQGVNIFLEAHERGYIKKYGQNVKKTIAKFTI